MQDIRICARYKDIILLKLKGAAKNSAEAFADGTNVVTKHNVSWDFL